MEVMGMHNLTILNLLLLTLLSAVSLVQADSFGFSVELIHSDSANPPLSNVSQTDPSSWWANVLRRSSARVHRFSQALISPHSAVSPLYSDNTAHGTYQMEISIGTPSIKTVLVMDTASNLVWTNCPPCRGCLHTPLFDPTASSTYQKVSCNSRVCDSLVRPICGGFFYCPRECVDNICNFSFVPGDASTTTGVLATETLTLGSSEGQPVVLNNSPMGCATERNGGFDGSGVASLGKGPFSLISMMDPLIRGRFAHCLVPHFSKYSSKLHFGSEAVVSGPGVLTTPLNSEDPYRYNFTLEGITIEGNRIPGADPWGPTTKSNILMDSGNAVTVLPRILYRMLEARVREFVGLKPAEDFTAYTLGYNLCYNVKTVDLPRIPRITMHFTGADVELEPSNIFITVPGHDNACLAFSGSYINSHAVYGNTQQINFLIGYDLQSQTLSFKKTDCTKYSD